ncbi:MAG: Homoserine kinase [uncultured Chloroflexia bacterium]|uniref:Homoserine kinase n=1 Tax=uncultured Chloroflexia bacterium TaxID=1672391 RepID=A0A6J4NJD8_9CHLR|nr:MAG: Homoserine kinase [uncultured Chloroflexia bacterium]
MIDGVCWEYISAGDHAQALLLLPGGPGRGETSFQYILAFESDYRVIAPSYPACITAVDALVDGLVMLLHAEGIERTHVLGGSYSGMIAQCLLRRYPELVDRLVLSDTGTPNVRRAGRTRLLLGCIGVLPFGVVRALLKLGTYAFVHPMGTDRGFWQHYFHALLDGLVHDDLQARLEVAIDIDANKHFTPWAAPDWDEAHVDVPDLDLVMPHNAAGLDDRALDIAAQASAAWEAAVCWDDEYSVKRLAEVRAV